MMVKYLDITTYAPDGSRYRTETVHDPSWPQIEASLRALDHHDRPFIFLGLEDNYHETDCLSVLGGPHGYAFTGTIGDGPWLQYVDPTQGDDEVAVWTSDQGFYPKARNVCFDLELVVRIAKHFSESGELAPFVRWE